MASAELVVLIVALLVGLALGAFLAWATLLTSPGRGLGRAKAGLVEGQYPRVGTAEGTGRSLVGAFLAIVCTLLLLAFLVPGTVPDLPTVDDVPGGAFTLAFATLIFCVVLALPQWLGVRR
jgi:hypothetical protein